MGNAKGRAIVKAAVGPEKEKHEKVNNEHEKKEEGNPLDTNILNIRYSDNPNLVTNTSYVLSDSAEIGED